MSRYLFGGSSDDYAVGSDGRPVTNRRVRFYTSAAMTTEITDVASDAAGTGSPLTVTTNTAGFWGPVYGPDAVTVMYAGAVDSVGNPPTYVVAVYAHYSSEVASFNGRTGPIVLTKVDVTGTGLAATDVGADAAGAAAAAQAASAQKSANLSDLASAATARTNLGLGSAATQPTTAFDAAGAAATVQTNLTAETTRAQNAEAAITNGLKNVQAAAAATTNQALTGLPTVDGVTLTAGQVILLAGQTAGSQNGLWTVAVGAWARPSNFAAGADATGTNCWVEAGTSYASSSWIVTGTTNNVIGTNVLTWQQVSGLGEVTAAAPLTKTGNTLGLASSAAAGTYTAANVTIDAYGRVTAAANGAYLAARKLTNGSTFRHQARGARFFAGYDATDDVTWWKTTNIGTSPDDGTTFIVQPMPVGIGSATSLGGIVRWGSKVYIQGIAGDGFAHVYSSQPPSAGTVAWTDALTTAGTALLLTLHGTTWGSSDYLFMGEYGAPSGGPSVWRSPDGVTWTKVLGPIAANHIHAIASDPYNPGHVYMTAGDGQSKVMYRSTDYGSTWTLHVTDNNFQAVQISFSTDYVWFAGDGDAVTVWVVDRNNPTVPIVAAANHHSLVSVPGGLGARGPFDDGVTASGGTTYKSASASFNNDDQGRFVRFTGSPPISESSDTYIQTVTDGQTVSLNKAATGATTGVTFYLEGDRFYRGAFYGAVDPATGIYYCVANDSTSGGNRTALFYLPNVGGRLELLDVMSQPGAGAVRFAHNKLWFHQVSHPLLTVA